MQLLISEPSMTTGLTTEYRSRAGVSSIVGLITCFSIHIPLPSVSFNANRDFIIKIVSICDMGWAQPCYSHNAVVLPCTHTHPAHIALL